MMQYRAKQKRIQEEEQIEENEIRFSKSREILNQINFNLGVYKLTKSIKFQYTISVIAESMGRVIDQAFITEWFPKFSKDILKAKLKLSK